jgi:hypothetical protein
MSQRKPARDAYRAAIELALHLQTSERQDREVSYELAGSYYNRGILLSEGRDSQAAADR